MTSRIAGALAHELNNPLQAALSLIAVMRRDNEADVENQQRLELLRRGVLRASSIVETLAVLYENAPREPDHIRIAELAARIEAGLCEQGIECVTANTLPQDMTVRCLAPELVRLLVIAASASIAQGAAVRIDIIDIEGDQERVALIMTPAADHLSDNEFLPLPDEIPVSGLSVMIDEIATLGRGEARFCFDDNRLKAIRIGLRTMMDQESR